MPLDKSGEKMGIRDRIIEEELKLNLSAWDRCKSSYVEDSEFIEHQCRMGDIYYGRHFLLFKRRRYPASYNSCEIIATYNALLDLDSLGECDFPTLISRYHKNGIFFAGLFGTRIHSIKRLLIKLGLNARFICKKKLSDYYESLEKACDGEEAEGKNVTKKTYIVSFWNSRRTIFHGLHTVSITVANGGYRIHNNSTSKRFGTLRECIDYINEDGRLISVIEVTR